MSVSTSGLAAELGHLWEPNGAHEVRILTGGSVHAGVFGDPALAAEALLEWDGQARGVYHTLNPVAVATTDRITKVGKGESIGDSQIVYRRFLVFDLDPVRRDANGAPLEDQKVPSTDAEASVAKERSESVSDWLCSAGWPEGFRLFTGNGWWLGHRIEEPNTAEAKTLVNAVLKAVAARFSSATVAVDLKMGNAARIGKVPLTMTRKGAPTTERPHRRAGRLLLPEGGLTVVSHDLLERIAALAPQPKPAPPRTAYTGPAVDSDDWLGTFLRDHGIAVGARQDLDSGGWLRELDQCPFVGDHNAGHAFVGVNQHGAMFFGCHGNRCDGRGWEEFRERYDPAALRPQRDDLSWVSTGRRHGHARLARPLIATGNGWFPPGENWFRSKTGGWW